MSSRRSRRDTGPPYLLDTHIWVWYLGGSDRLSAGLRRLLDSTLDQLWLSPISVWELGLLHGRGRIRVAPDLRAWVDEAFRRVPLEEAPVTREVALMSHELRLPHRDPADRLLAASALVFELTLLTVDERLRAARWLPTRSA